MSLLGLMVEIFCCASLCQFICDLFGFNKRRQHCATHSTWAMFVKGDTLSKDLLMWVNCHTLR